MVLPLGEITEGGIETESTLGGTLYGSGAALKADICVTREGFKSCTTTNDLGEYVLAVPAGMYDVEIRTFSGERFKSKIDLTTPAVYRDLLKIEKPKTRK
jgi:hypothetical protein